MRGTITMLMPADAARPGSASGRVPSPRRARCRATLGTDGRRCRGLPSRSVPADCDGGSAGASAPASKGGRAIAMTAERLIVVGVDGSDGGRRALVWAVRRAAASGAKVQVVTVYAGEEPTLATYV